jgi:hypothetical protein
MRTGAGRRCRGRCVALARPLHQRRWARPTWPPPCCCGLGIVSAAPEGGRPRPRRAGAARRFALQPRQRLHGCQLRASSDIRGDGQDAGRPMRRSTPPWPKVDALAGSCAAAGRGFDQLDGRAEQAAPSPATTKATSNGMTCSPNQARSTRCTAARRANCSTELLLLSLYVYLKDHKADTLAAWSRPSSASPPPTTRRRAVPAGGRQRRHRSGHQHRRQGGHARHAVLGLRRGDPAVLASPSALARGAVSPSCRWC